MLQGVGRASRGFSRALKVSGFTCHLRFSVVGCYYLLKNPKKAKEKNCHVALRATFLRGS